MFSALLRYDNLKSAVKKILRGYRREETSRFIAFRSHWRFQSEFCNPARGNEKGGVEGEGGYFRRNHWVPLPEARDLDELNAYLERCCRARSAARVWRAAARRSERRCWMSSRICCRWPASRSIWPKTSFPTVDGLRCVRVRTNRYSAPLTPGTQVEARVSADYVELWHEGVCVARHERCFSRLQQILDLEHYLDVLRAQAGRTGRFDAAGAVAAGRTLARVLRPVMASVEHAAWPAGRHAADDRSARAGQRRRLGSHCVPPWNKRSRSAATMWLRSVT